MNTPASSNSWRRVPHFQRYERPRNETARPREKLIGVEDLLEQDNVGPELKEVHKIVRSTLLQMQDACRFEDLDLIMSLVVPKVLYDLHALDKLNDELEYVKQTLNSYTRHSKVLGDDVTEIYLDLHNIYSKLDRYDRTLPKKLREQHGKQCKRLKEAERFLENAKHFIRNNKTPIVTPTHSSHKEPKRVQRDVSINQTRDAEKRAFLSNMIMLKKSEFSMGLNRSKNYYSQAERALKKGSINIKKKKELI